MKNRIIGGLIIIVITIPCIIVGGVLFAVFANLIGMLALYELINVNKDLKDIPTYMKLLSFVTVPLLAFGNINDAYFYGIDYVSLIIPLLLLLTPVVFIKDKYPINKAFLLCFTSLFIGIITHMYVTLFDFNKYLFVFIVIIACFTDIFAYLGGLLFGKHKFTKISPNKTIEGCVIGTIFGSTAGFIFYNIFFNISNGVLLLAVVLILSVVGQLGDMFFSKIKRDNDVKDYSEIIPGHGGICDRIDSLTFILLVFILIQRFL